MITRKALSLGVKAIGTKLVSVKKQATVIMAVLLIAAMLVPTASPLAANYSTGYPNTWTNTGNQANDIAQIALTQVGYAETGNNHTKYSAWYYGSDVPVAWCAIFISWCAKEAGISTSTIAKNALASGFSTSNMSKNSYGCPAVAFGNGSAQVGDIIYVSSSGGGSTNHVGLVVAVDNNYIYTVEGNSSSKVSKVKYLVSNGHRVWGTYQSSARIVFYARPNYKNTGKPATTTTTTTEAATTTTTEGTITTTTEAVTVLTTAAATSTNAAGTAEVNGTTATVAAGTTAAGTTAAGTTTNGTAANGTTAAGTTATGTAAAGTTTNGTAEATANGTTGTAVVSEQAATVSAGVGNAGGSYITDGNYTTGIYTLATTMYMRKSADVNSDIIGVLKEGATIMIPQVDGYFGYITIDGKQGWVSLKYAKRLSQYLPGAYTVTHEVNMRESATSESKKIASLGEGTNVKVTDISGSYGLVTYKDLKAWICLDYAKLTAVNPNVITTVVAEPEKTVNAAASTTYSVGVYKLNSAVHMRGEANKDSADLGILPEGTVLNVIKIEGEFGYINLNGTKGWVAIQYATKQ